MNSEVDWSSVKGWDTDGLAIWASLLDLKQGRLCGDDVSELLSDLIRESMPSSAAYPSIPHLLEAVRLLPWGEAFEVLLTVAFIVVRSAAANSPGVPPSLSDYFSSTFRAHLQTRLLGHSAEANLSVLNVVYLANALLALSGREDLASAVFEGYFSTSPEASSASDV